MTPTPRTDMERFYRFIEPSEHGCWPWQGGIIKAGYGHFAADGRTWKAHRWIMDQLYGPIPGDLVIDHLCLNKVCVRPDHLEIVTYSQNRLRAIGPYCKWGHPWTTENTRYDKRGRRVCRRCLSQRRTKGIRVPKEQRILYKETTK